MYNIYCLFQCIDYVSMYVDMCLEIRIGELIVLYSFLRLNINPLQFYIDARKFFYEISNTCFFLYLNFLIFQSKQTSNKKIKALRAAGNKTEI